MRKPNFKEFTLLAMLQDQSEVVRFIIQNEDRIDPEECFYNKYDISINLSSGKETMPSQQYHNKVNRLGAMYRSLSTRMKELDDQHEDTSAIEIEVESIHSLLLEYDDAEYADREIHEWRLISFWIAERFIQMGETVFRHMGNNWWGVKDVMLTGILNHKILTEIYEGMP